MTGAQALLAKLAAFPWDDWNASLAGAMLQPARDLVIRQAVAASAAAGGTLQPDDPFLDRFVTDYVLERATQINAVTREALSDLIIDTFNTDDGSTPAELGQLVLDRMREDFEGYEQWRADRIARTEPAIIYNDANVLGWADAGVTEIDVLDGEDDDICAEANGERWSLESALDDPIGHPNCTRAFLPVIDAQHRGRRMLTMAVVSGWATAAARAAERIFHTDDPCHARQLDAIDEDATE